MVHFAMSKPVENFTMQLDSKIFIAGHRGLVGSAIVRHLEKEGYKNLVRLEFRLHSVHEEGIFPFFPFFFSFFFSCLHFRLTDSV